MMVAVSCRGLQRQALGSSGNPEGLRGSSGICFSYIFAIFHQTSSSSVELAVRYLVWGLGERSGLGYARGLQH